MDDFKVFDLVKIIGKDKYGVVDSINSIKNEVNVVFNGDSGKNYYNYKFDEVIRIGELKYDNYDIKENGIVRIRDANSALYNAIAKVKELKLNSIGETYAILSVYDDGDIDTPVDKYLYVTDNLQQYNLLTNFPYEEFELDDLVLIKETGDYGIVNLIREDMIRVCYYDTAVGKICNSFANDDLTLAGKLKENVDDVKVNDIVIINNNDFAYNNYFGKVIYLNDDLVVVWFENNTIAAFVNKIYG